MILNFYCDCIIIYCDCIIIIINLIPPLPSLRIPDLCSRSALMAHCP